MARRGAFEPVGGIDEAIAALNLARDSFIEKYSITISRVLQFVHRSILDRHPVWSGESIAAWRWSTDAPQAGTGVAGKRYTKAEMQRFGETSKMALGLEPMRAVMTAGVEAQFASFRVDPKDPFHKYIMSNNHWRTELLEYGELPKVGSSRNPAGMVRVTAAELNARIGLLFNLA